MTTVFFLIFIVVLFIALPVFEFFAAIRSDIKKSDQSNGNNDS